MPFPASGSSAKRGIIDEIDDEGFCTYLGAQLESVGSKLIPALDRMQRYWRHMVGVYVAPRFDATVREELARADARPYDEWRFEESARPVVCKRAYPECDLWPDGRVQDGFWLEGNLDQARALLGRLSFEHQVQLEVAANEKFCVLVSRDGTQRLGMDYRYPFSNQWMISPFVFIPQFVVESVDQLRGVPLPE